MNTEDKVHSAEAAPGKRLEFERFLADLSARLVAVPPERVDDEIRNALKEVLEFFQIDRCSLLRLMPGKTHFQITHNAVADGIEPFQIGTPLPALLFPWTTKKLAEQREVFSFERLEELPEEAVTDKQTFEKFEVRSGFFIPIAALRSSEYSIGIGSGNNGRSLPGEYIPRLRLLGELFVNAVERSRGELALRESEERFRQVVENVGDFIWEVDANGLYRYTSPSVERILGYRPDELIGKKYFYDLLAPEVREEFKAAAFAAFAARQPFRAFPNPKLSKEGEVVYLETSGTPVLDAAGNLLGYRGADIDVTARKRSEEEIHRARAELLRIERSFRINELTASLAHELNQPLAAILSNAQAALRFLETGKPDLNEIREILRDIVHDDKRAGNVIRSLRSMMRRTEEEKKPVMLKEVIEDVIAILHSEAVFRNVHIESDLGESLPPVLADRIQLQQVILNLIMNATEALPQNRPEERKIILRTEAADSCVRASVRDFGRGIEKENLDRLFQPFFTTKGSGLGMGLTLTKSIIEANGGRIWGENHPDGGAIFAFELPVIGGQ